MFFFSYQSFRHGLVTFMKGSCDSSAPLLKFIFLQTSSNINYNTAPPAFSEVLLVAECNLSITSFYKFFSFWPHFVHCLIPSINGDIDAGLLRLIRNRPSERVLLRRSSVDKKPKLKSHFLIKRYLLPDKQIGRAHV